MYRRIRILVLVVIKFDFIYYIYLKSNDDEETIQSFQGLVTIFVHTHITTQNIRMNDFLQHEKQTFPKVVSSIRVFWYENATLEAWQSFEI